MYIAFGIVYSSLALDKPQRQYSLVQPFSCVVLSHAVGKIDWNVDPLHC